MSLADKKKLEITANVPARPDWGSMGRNLQVAANMFEVSKLGLGGGC